MSDPWADADDAATRLGTACARPLAPLLRVARVDVSAWAVLLRARLRMDARGGPFGTGGERARLARVLLPLGLLLMGLFFGAVELAHPLAPWRWMALLQTALLLVLALPLVTDIGILLDRDDERVLEPHPIDARTRLAARLAHVALRIAPPAVALCAGPMTLGFVHHTPLALLVALPLGTALALLGLVSGYVLVHALAGRILGERIFRRIGLALEIVAGAGLMGAGAILAVVVGTPLVLLLGMGGDLEDLSPWTWTLPPVQLGGLFELLSGHVTSTTLTLGGLACATPLATALAALLLTPRQTALDPAMKAPGARWPHASRRGDATTRAGFELARALVLRDRLVARTYWQMALGGLAAGLIAMQRTGALLGEHAHWSVFALWITMVLPGTCASAVGLSAQPEAAWIFGCVGAGSRDRVTTGVLRGAWLVLGLPTAVLIGLGALAVGGTSVLPDTLFMLAVAFVLGVEFQIASSAVTPFASSRHMVRAQPRDVRPLAAKTRRGQLLLVVPLVLGMHVAIHAYAGLMWIATLSAAALVVRGWHRLDLLRVSSEHPAELEPDMRREGAPTARRSA